MHPIPKHISRRITTKRVKLTHRRGNLSMHPLTFLIFLTSYAFKHLFILRTVVMAPYKAFFTRDILQRAGGGVLLIPWNVERTPSHHTALAMDGVTCRLFYVRTTYGATMRHMCRWFLGHYIRHWRAGHPKATMLQGISLVSLAVFAPCGRTASIMKPTFGSTMQTDRWYSSGFHRYLSKTEDSLCVCRAN